MFNAEPGVCEGPDHKRHRDARITRLRAAA